MRRESGLNTGLPSAALPDVSRRGGTLPSLGTIHRSLPFCASSYAGSDTAITIQRPSGLTAMAPMRFISQTSSWVIGRPPADWAGAAAKADGDPSATSRNNDRNLEKQRWARTIGFTQDIGRAPTATGRGRKPRSLPTVL